LRGGLNIRRPASRIAAGAGLFFLLAAPLTPGAGAAEPVTIDGIAAIVNGEVITLLELEKAGKPLVDKKLLTALKRERAKVKREVLTSVLDRLILRTIQRQRADQIGVRVGDKEVDDAIGKIMETNALTEDMLDRALAEEGLTREEYRRDIADQVLFTKLMQREIKERITVTPEEIEAYYEAHKEEYFQPERIRVRHILVKSGEETGEEGAQEARKEALEILEEFRAGADFADLVRRHSPETSAEGQTVSAWLRRGEFLAELEEVAFTLPVNRVSEPIRSQAGFHLIQVVARQNESYLSLGAVADTIEETLSRQKMEANYQVWLTELRDEAQVDILY